MRNLWHVGLGLAVVALLASSAQAQRQPGFGRGGSLLTNKSVQEELKLNDDQKKKVEEVAKKMGEMIREKTKDFKQEDFREKFPAVMKEVNEAVAKDLSGVLKDDQSKRYKQIQLQQMGIRAFSNEDTTKALKLTDEQKKDITALIEENGKQITEKTKDLTRQDFAKRREISQQVSKETMGKIATKLTSDQKKTWKDLVGEPFEIKFERPRPPGGGTTPRTDLN